MRKRLKKVTMGKVFMKPLWSKGGLNIETGRFQDDLTIQIKETIQCS